MKKMTLALLATLLLPATGTCTEWGTITGTVVLDGDVPAPVLLSKKGAKEDESGAVIKDPEACSAIDMHANDLVIDKDTKGIANVFIYLYKKPKQINEESTKVPPSVVLDQKNCVFLPHALVLQAGQAVEVINSDPIPHNTHSNPIKNQSKNELVPANTVAGRGVMFPLNARDSVPIKVNCDIHPSMMTYWLVMDHPYAAVTDAKGKFTIKNLPVGEHEFRIWHERPGYVYKAEGTRDRHAFTVTAGEQKLDPITVKLSQLESN